MRSPWSDGCPARINTCNAMLNEHVSRLTKKILVVDDVLDIAETTGKLLSMLGYRTSLAHDGQEAIDKAMAEQPDVVLLDLQMPVLDGFSAAREIRRARPGGPPMLIALSAMAHLCGNDALTACGFDHCITKPADLNRLVALIEGT